MKIWVRRYLSLLLACVMIVGMLPGGLLRVQADATLYFTNLSNGDVLPGNKAFTIRWNEVEGAA